MTTTPAGTQWLPYGFAVLAVCAVVLLVAGFFGRSRVAWLPSVGDYFASWARFHDDIVPRGMVAWWLRGVYVVARPLASAGVSPSVLTGFGLVLAGLVPCIAVVGPGWPAVAGLVVVLSALLDNLDGAVAVLTSRTSGWGFVLDSLVDRLADGLYLVTFWLLGAAGWLCVAAGVALGLLEYVRARAGNAAMGSVSVVTVGERPTRVIIAATFLVTVGIFSAHAASVSAVAVVLTGVVALVGLGQLLAFVRRTLP